MLSKPKLLKEKGLQVMLPLSHLACSSPTINWSGIRNWKRFSSSKSSWLTEWENARISILTLGYLATSRFAGWCLASSKVLYKGKDNLSSTRGRSSWCRSHANILLYPPHSERMPGHFKRTESSIPQQVPKGTKWKISEWGLKIRALNTLPRHMQRTSLLVVNAV